MLAVPAAAELPEEREFRLAASAARARNRRRSEPSTAARCAETDPSQPVCLEQSVPRRYAAADQAPADTSASQYGGTPATDYLPDSAAGRGCHESRWTVRTSRRDRAPGRAGSNALQSIATVVPPIPCPRLPLRPRIPGRLPLDRRVRNGPVNRICSPVRKGSDARAG